MHTYNYNNNNNKRDYHHINKKKSVGSLHANDDTIIIAATLNVATAILMESSLSFLGLGIQQPNSSWGSMLNNAQGYMGEAWHLTLFPGFFILLTVLSFNVLGDVLRNALDPKSNKKAS